MHYLSLIVRKDWVNTNWETAYKTVALSSSKMSGWWTFPNSGRLKWCANWMQCMILDWILIWEKKIQLYSYKGHYWDHWWNLNMNWGPDESFYQCQIFIFENVFVLRKHTEALMGTEQDMFRLCSKDSQFNFYNLFKVLWWYGYARLLVQNGYMSLKWE